MPQPLKRSEIGVLALLGVFVLVELVANTPTWAHALTAVGLGVAVLGLAWLWDVTARRAWGPGVWVAFVAAVLGVGLMVLAWWLL